MLTSLLSAKLIIPPQRRPLVVRERLFARLDAAANLKAALVLAPAGSGKTTLVSQWAARSGLPVAWLSLDKGDDDPAHFLAATLAALQTVEPGLRADLLAGLQGPHALPLPAVLTHVVNGLAAVRPLLLVWDDYHVLRDPRVHEAAVFLLNHRPAGLRLVVIARADPPWPLARLRACQEVAELRAQDLRFTPQEARQYLNQTMGLGLAESDAEVLAERTEGWIAGLQMAALSLQGQTQPRVTDFVSAFTGTHRFVVDFLVEEVLARQPADIQEFLLKTSILETLCGPLCDALLHGSERPAAAVLEELERANLFLIPLDDERCWYRYHHLFADLLRQRLKQRWPGQVGSLHSRASLWYENAGRLAKAARHALAAGDVQRVARLAERDALAMFDRGELAGLAGWLTAIPSEIIHARPWLCVAQAWTLAYAGPLETLAPLLEQIEQSQDHVSAEARPRLAGHLAAIRAYAAWLRGEGASAAHAAGQALAQLPDRDVLARALAATTQGAALCDEGALPASAQASEQSIAISQAAGATHVRLLASANLAYVRHLMGQLHAAADACRQALGEDGSDRGELRLPAAGAVYSVYSQVQLEWNDLAGAERSARRGLSLGRQWGHKDSMAIASMYLAGILTAAGDAAGALKACAQAGEASGDLSPWYRRLVQGAEARVRLLLGDVDAAGRWAQASGLRAEDAFSFQEWTVYRTLALVWCAQGQTAAALAVLARLAALAETAGARGIAIQIGVLRAVALQAQGRMSEALPVLERSLALAEPEGFVRAFIAVGAPAAGLLRAVRDRGVAVNYVARLLKALDGGEPQLPPPAGPPPALLEPLSERECAVLRLLATSLSFAEIAAELHIAVSTARTHAKTIYGKLGAHGRLGAIEHARRLGLL